MGKIRVKTLGIEEIEQKQRQEAKKRKEEKSVSRRTAKAPGLKGGERIVAVGPTEEELAKIDVSEDKKTATTEAQKEAETQKFGVSGKFSASAVARKTSKVKPKRIRSKNYQTVAKMVDRTKAYPLKDALDLLSKIHLSRFDETVELHINATQPKISVVTTLPHGTGKKLRVAIADEKLIENVAKGKIDFDVLLAAPTIMPKLARVAKFLGPKGLMPNPKSGTISNNPEELAKKYEGGQMTIKTESKAPVIHISVGKLSFREKKLAENIQAIFTAVKPENIKNATLKSTMSPGIRVKLV